MNFKINGKIKLLIMSVHKHVICNVPKVHTVFRDKLLENLFLLNENVVRANINVGNIRLKYQKEALVNIAMIDAMVGFLMDLGYIEKKRFMSIIANLNEIRMMVNGWVNSEKNKD